MNQQVSAALRKKTKHKNQQTMGTTINNESTGKCCITKKDKTQKPTNNGYNNKQLISNSRTNAL